MNHATQPVCLIEKTYSTIGLGRFEALVFYDASTEFHALYLSSQLHEHETILKQRGRAPILWDRNLHWF